jgi:hypothetical protein
MARWPSRETVRANNVDLLEHWHSWLWTKFHAQNCRFRSVELVESIECTVRCTVYMKRHRKIFQRVFSDNGAARWERVHWCAAPSDRLLWEKVDLWPCCLHIEDTRRAKDMLSQTPIICLLQNMRSNESLSPFILLQGDRSWCLAQFHFFINPWLNAWVTGKKVMILKQWLDPRSSYMRTY